MVAALTALLAISIFSDSITSSPGLPGLPVLTCTPALIPGKSQGDPVKPVALGSLVGASVHWDYVESSLRLM